MQAPRRVLLDDEPQASEGATARSPLGSAVFEKSRFLR